MPARICWRWGRMQACYSRLHSHSGTNLRGKGKGGTGQAGHAGLSLIKDQLVYCNVSKRVEQ
jgi:hypothetical protein